MQWAKSEGRRLVDYDLGRMAQSPLRKHAGGEAGRRKCGAGEICHDLAGTGGGLCSIAICSKLSLSGGRMERL